MSTAPATAIADLLGRESLQVIAPHDSDYDEARKVFVGGIDKRPAAIVRVRDAGDVARVVKFARDRGVPLAIRSGGHSSLGHSTTDGGIVLDLTSMKGYDIDLATKTVWAEAGLTAVELTKALEPHGLAVGFGDTGSVGIGGITLGGGQGYLSRKFGLTIDSLLAAELVTADGALVRVDGRSHPDLFWAIRGGGGNFGVAVRFQYRAQQVPQIYGGMLMLPATADTVAGFVAAAAAAPDELSAIGNVGYFPPMPFVPAEHQGKPVIFALLCYAGDAEAGARAIAPFRALATPIADFVHPGPYAEMYPPEDPNYHPVGANRTMFLERVDRGTAQVILDQLDSHIHGSKAFLVVAQLRILGGAIARVPADATAYSHRASRIMVNLAALYDPSTDDGAVHERWVGAFADALRQGDDGAYVNFLASDRPEAVRRAYPARTYDRLVEIKRRYDPTNLFRLNVNIAPS